MWGLFRTAEAPVQNYGLKNYVTLKNKNPLTLRLVRKDFSKLPKNVESHFVLKQSSWSTTWKKKKKRSCALDF